MRKVVVSELVTLDGVTEAPDQWFLQFRTQESGQFKFDELFASDALLLGRVTYEGFAAAWPSATDEQGYANRMNSLPKFVVSTTLQEPTWSNTTVIKENVAQEITRLKEQPGQDILVFGSTELVHTLAQHNLIDEYRLMVFPVVVGKGKHLFKAELNKKVLKLAATKAFSSGIVLNTYQPVEAE